MDLCWQSNAQLVKNSPAMRKTRVWSLGWEDPLEQGKSIYSSKRVRHDWATFSRRGARIKRNRGQNLILEQTSSCAFLLLSVKLPFSFYLLVISLWWPQRVAYYILCSIWLLSVGGYGSTSPLLEVGPLWAFSYWRYTLQRVSSRVLCMSICSSSFKVVQTFPYFY